MSLATAISADITEAFRKLLEEKHLYQAVDVGAAAVEALVPELLSPPKSKRLMAPLSFVAGSATPAPKKEDFVYTAKTLLSQNPWVSNLGLHSATEAATASFLATLEASKTVHFDLPQTVHTYCKVCKKVWPFNPDLSLGKAETSIKAPTNQWFYLGYSCQSCKSEPIRFLVRRQGTKLRLCGRDPMGEVTVPEVLPKATRDFFGSALIACNAGQTLAGIFFLRVFIEQFWRSLPTLEAPLKANSRLTGDEMGGLYNDTLPADFKSRFPSLSGVYSDLSAAIHMADANAETFEKCAGQITEHFDALRLYKIPT